MRTVGGTVRVSLLCESYNAETFSVRFKGI